MPTKKADQREIDELAERMLRVLESQRLLGPEAYPPTLRRLAELSGLNGSDTKVPQAAAKAAFKDRAIVAWNDEKARKPSLDAPVILASKDDLDTGIEMGAPAVLVALLRNATSPRNQALSVAKLKDQLPEKLQKPFKAAIERGIEQRSLPPEVAWIVINRSRVLFLIDDIQTSSGIPAVGADGQASPLPIPTTHPAASVPEPIAPPPAAVPLRIAAETTSNGATDFAEAFREAFARLDRENRSSNFVRLLDIRRALPQFDRDQFDSGLRRLRLDDEFTLDSHEGSHRPLTDEERDAGVREAGSLLVYVCRRS